jgi:penicillin-binding protein 2
MDKENIILEESVLDDLSEGFDIVEKPIGRKEFIVFGWVVIFILVIVFGRLIYFQIIKGNSYFSRSLLNAGRQLILKSPRGIIYDRNQESLVSNQPSFDLSLNLSELFRNKGEIDLILEKISAVVPFDIEEAKKKIFSVNLENQAYLTLISNVELSKVIELKKLNIPSLVIDNNYSRKYVDGPIFSHILGYTGLVSADDIKKNPELDLNDQIGKSGIEAVYDNQLRGKNGVAILYKDAKGNLIDTKTLKDPVGGNFVHTTIDADLQRYFYNALKEQLAFLNRTAGAGIVMDPSTGQILSLVSLPSFDNNFLKPSLFVDKSMPTFNRVISGLYSPGSTIKPLVAFAALKEKIIDPFKKILSIGYIEIPNPYFPDKPSKFVDWRPHGWIDLKSALARSSNVYFYEVGGGFKDQSPDGKFGRINQVGLGIEKLRQYWKEFLLDKKTGIDLLGELSGVLASPLEKENKTGEPWRIGDTYNVSIGQGDLRITPIELLRYISAIYNRGKLPKPFVVDSIKDISGNILYQAHPSFDEISKEPLDDEYFRVVEEGMIDAVSKDYGTAHLLSDIPIKIAAKTGSAQIQNNQKTNAFFVGYNIPESSLKESDSKFPKQIAVLVLIEDAKEGSLNAVPVAKKVFEWYYKNRILENQTEKNQ